MTEKEVPSGANLQILVPYDDEVYYKVQEVDFVRVANPIQIYLNLYNYAGRGREQAEFLREIIEKRHLKLKVQTVRDHTCLSQAGTSDIRLMLKIKGKGPTEKGMRTLQWLIPYLKSSGV